MKRLCFTIIFYLFVADFSYANTAADIARNVFPSTVLVVVEDKDGFPLAEGSGFVVGPALIATNFHVIEGAASGYVKLIGSKELLPIIGVFGHNQKSDIAILQVENLSAPILKLGNADNISVGETVYVVGNPLGLEGTFSNGIISGLRRDGADVLIQMTAPISPGSSGGPVMDKNGEVIGVATATYSEGQSLNFAVPISYVLSAISDAKTVISLGKLRSQVPNTERSSGKKNSNTPLKITHLEKFAHIGYTLAAMKFSIKNTSRRVIKNIKTGWILRDNYGEPVDYKEHVYVGNIPPRLAKRASVDLYADTIVKDVEVRILSFEFAD